MTMSFRAPALLLLTAGLSACGSSARSAPLPTPIPEAPVIHIDLPNVTPMAGASLPLAARVSWRTGELAASNVRWSVVRGDHAWVAPNGVLTLLEPGEVTVRARSGTMVVERRITVEPNVAARVVMDDRVVPRAQVGDTVRVAAFVYDALEQRVVHAPVAYALVARGQSPDAAVVTEDGRFVANEPGVYTVVATCGRVSGRTIVIVEGAEERFAAAMRRGEVEVPAAVAPVPADDSAHAATAARPSLAAVAITARPTRKVDIDGDDPAAYEGTTLALSARVWVDGEREPDSTAQVVWTSSDQDVAYVDQRGRVVFLSAGTVKIVAAHAGRVATRRFEVRVHPAARLALRPSRADARVGEPVRFREEVWQVGAYPVTDARVNYAIIAHGESDAPVPATLTERREFVARRPGVYTVIAEVGGVADQFTLFVRPVEPPPAKVVAQKVAAR